MSNVGETRRFHNLEGHAEYDFSLRSGGERTGVSAMLRIKNEAPKIRCCLMSLLGIFDEIVIVDNGSTDGTHEIVRAFKEEYDRTVTVARLDYPFSIARCGPEHAATREDSVHSLAYYYNWALSHCTRRYVCKWDADMVVKRQERHAFRAFLEQLDHLEPRAVAIPGQTVYKDAGGRCFLSTDGAVRERRLFPFSCDNYYVKVEHFEKIRFSPTLPITVYDGGVVFYELKFVDEDEFSHWSTTRFPTARKKREWDSVELLRTGQPIDGRLRPLPAGFLDDHCGAMTADRTRLSEGS
jgi:glycosyltransferase involved in cell wall biosynthesis